MPLMRCPDCGREISESAIACPHCGLPRPMYERQSRDRRQEEEDAAEMRARRITTFRMAGVAAGAVALVLLGLMLFSTWSRPTLGLKVKELVAAIIFGGLAYGFFRFAARLQGDPPR